MPRIPVSTKCRQQTADRIQNIDCRLQSGYKMQTENLKSFYVWYIITCHLTAYRASRNRFSAISLHDYLHYCGKFLAHFLMKIDRNIISSLQYSLLTMRASCLVWSLYRFYCYDWATTGIPVITPSLTFPWKRDFSTSTSEKLPLKAFSCCSRPNNNNLPVSTRPNSPASCSLMWCFGWVSSSSSCGSSEFL